MVATLFALLIAAAVVLHDPSAPATAPKPVALLLIAIVALACAWTSGRLRRLSSAAWAFVAGGAWTILSSVNDAQNVALWCAGGALLIAAHALPAAQVRRAMHLTATAIVVATSLILITQWLLGARGMHLEGGQGNPDWAAVTVAVALPLTFTGARRWWWVGLGVIALWLCRSRTAAFAIAVPSLAVIGLRLRRRERVVLAIAAIAAVAFLIAMNAGARHALWGRWWIWRCSAAAAMHALPWGSGGGQFANAFLEAQARALAPLSPATAARTFVYATTAHNECLHVLVEAGAPGLALLAALFALAMRACAKVKWAAGGATVLVVIVAAIAECPLHLASVIVLVAGVVAATEEHRIDSSPRTFAIVALIVVAYVLPSVTRVWSAARIAYRADQSMPDERERHLSNAARLDNDLALRLGLAELENGHAEAAATTLERAERCAPTVGGEVALGNAYLATHDLEGAATAYRRALYFDPGSLRATVNLADTELRMEHRDQAQRLLARARRLWPQHPAVVQLAERLSSSQ